MALHAMEMTPCSKRNAAGCDDVRDRFPISIQGVVFLNADVQACRSTGCFRSGHRPCATWSLERDFVTAKNRRLYERKAVYDSARQCAAGRWKAGGGGGTCATSRQLLICQFASHRATEIARPKHKRHPDKSGEEVRIRWEISKYRIDPRMNSYRSGNRVVRF